jgi:hypothetical protein
MTKHTKHLLTFYRKRKSNYLPERMRWLGNIYAIESAPRQFSIGSLMATTASGVKVAQHPQGLTLTPARDWGARSR